MSEINPDHGVQRQRFHMAANVNLSIHTDFDDLSGLGEKVSPSFSIAGIPPNQKSTSNHRAVNRLRFHNDQRDNDLEDRWPICRSGRFRTPRKVPADARISTFNWN
jgi:hypothetical protein